MSVTATTWAWSQSLPATAKLVLLALADHADDEGHCWPSLGRLEQMTGLNRSTITRALSSLDGMLISRDRSDGGVGHSTRYQLHIKQLPCAPIKQVQSATVAQGNGCREHRNSCTPHLKQVHSAPRTIIEPSEPSIKSSSATTKRFIQPTVEQVAAYVATRNTKIDPQQFVDHYTANGWMRGKSKIINWQACVRTWEKNQGQQVNNHKRADQYPARKKEDLSKYIQQPKRGSGR